MIPYLRQEKIVELLHSKEIVTIDEIKEHIQDASLSTLRRDLKSLEEEGKIESLTGGAVKLLSTSTDLPVSKKTLMNRTQKQSIAQTASQYIKDGDTIYLDSGTTCSELFQLICKKDITIITSNTDILALLNNIVAEVIFLGGHFTKSLSSVNGPITESNILKFNFDKAFLGANGADAKKGVTTPRVEEASKKEKVVNQSNDVYLLLDSSKFGKVFLSKAFDVEQCTIISDKNDEELSKKTKMIIS